MEDFKLILYILAIVAYFIYTAWRKAFKTPDDGAAPPPQERPRQERPTPRPMPQQAPPQSRQQRPAGPATSFEDILREMQSKMDRANERGREIVEKPQPAPRSIPEPVLTERVPKRALSLEDPEQARMYERKKKERSGAAEITAEIKRHKRLERPNVYAELLHNPQSVRQAFILSEIFNRKQY